MGIRSQNNPLAAYLDVFSRSGTDAVTPYAAPSGLTATGGVISDYTDGPAVYRSHIFTSSGALDVTAPGSYGDTVDYLVVAGGGGGGCRGGGGGAGGLRATTDQTGGGGSLESQVPVAVAPYAVVIGGGGSGSFGTSAKGVNGVNSSLAYNGGTITSTGGGGAGSDQSQAGATGGSGGGGSNSGAKGSGTSNQGSGGSPASGDANGGGGGAGATANPGMTGGAGVQVAIAGPTATTVTGVGAKNPANNQYQYFAGGGGGGHGNNGTPGAGGVGGGGAGVTAIPSGPGVPGTSGTGGGGGGGGSEGSPTGYAANPGGAGGSGVVIVRYQIASLTATAKATGGAISFYGGKTIHAFTGSGTFATEPNWSAATVEYVVIGGGGGGGVNEHGGGGGAGAYRTGTTPIGAHPVSTSIQVGGGGIQNKGIQNPLPAAYQGTPSYFGTPITSPGGGGGGVDDGQSPFPTTAPGEQGMPGGSGGGSALDKTDAGGPSTGASFPGTIGATPVNGWGHPGGVGSRSPIGGGGGGGAGGAGAAPPTKLGGIGIQLPATFRDPVSAVGAPGPTSPSVTGADNSGKYYVAGGGAAQPAASGSAGGGGYYTPSPAQVYRAVQNTGSGGGASPIPYVTSNGRSGGASGLVLIAYPS